MFMKKEFFAWYFWYTSITTEIILLNKIERIHGILPFIKTLYTEISKLCAVAPQEATASSQERLEAS